MTDDLLPVAQYGPEVEREAGAPARAVGAALAAGGILGAVMAFQEPGLRRFERIVSGVAGGAMVVAGGLVGAHPPLLVVPARRRAGAFATVCYVGAARRNGLRGGYRTPAFFPAMLLTAAGAGVAGDAASGVRAGGAVAAGYLLGCVRSLEPGASPSPASPGGTSRARRRSSPPGAWAGPSASCPSSRAP